MVRRRLRTAAVFALAGLLATGSTGCVRRRYTIRSDPPGALVTVNGEEIGRAPVSRSFVFYADREITLQLDGYETQRVIQPMPAPWYDNLLTEFISECVVPVTIRDDREYTYRMSPTVVPKLDDLQARGEALRADAKKQPAPRRGGILGFFGF